MRSEVTPLILMNIPKSNALAFHISNGITPFPFDFFVFLSMFPVNLPCHWSASVWLRLRRLFPQHFQQNHFLPNKLLRKF